jgi:hypothetical protein
LSDFPSTARSWPVGTASFPRSYAGGSLDNRQAPGIPARFIAAPFRLCGIHRPDTRTMR